MGFAKWYLKEKKKQDHPILNDAMEGWNACRNELSKIIRKRLMGNNCERDKEINCILFIIRSLKAKNPYI